MANIRLRGGVMLPVLIAATAAYAAIGDFTGTATPTVVTPPTTPAPQTPPYPQPPIGTSGGFFYAPVARPMPRGRGGAPYGPTR
jgi:hypothetical protein